MDQFVTVRTSLPLFEFVLGYVLLFCKGVKTGSGTRRPRSTCRLFICFYVHPWCVLHTVLFDSYVFFLSVEIVAGCMTLCHGLRSRPKLSVLLLYVFFIGIS